MLEHSGKGVQQWYLQLHVCYTSLNNYIALTLTLTLPPSDLSKGCATFTNLATISTLQQFILRIIHGSIHQLGSCWSSIYAELKRFVHSFKLSQVLRKGVTSHIIRFYSRACYIFAIASVVYTLCNLQTFTTLSLSVCFHYVEVHFKALVEENNITTHFCSLF